MSGPGIGIDIGSDAVHVVAGVEKKGVFQVREAVRLRLKGPASAPAQVGALLRQQFGKKAPDGPVFCGLTGRDVVIRYTHVPPVPDWQLRQLMEFEVKEIVEQSGDVLAADFNLIPVASDLTSEDTVLLALAKEGLLADRLAACEAAFGRATAFVPNSIALYNAYRKCGAEDGTTLLVNIGAKNTDLALARDGDILFARNLSGGGALFDEALVATFNVSAEKAKSLKEELADVGATHEGGRLTSQEEKVSRALSGATGQLLSMVQSSVVFARSQTGLQELAVDRVLLCGGGALLKGLDKYLAANMGVPVTRFDPFEKVDASQVELDDATRSGAAVALGLAVSAAGADVYSVEILPPALKKQRTLRERTVFVGLAAALAVGLLAHDAWTSRKDTVAAARNVSQLQAEYRSRERRAKDFEDLTSQRNERAVHIELLEERVTPGVGLSRTMLLLQRYLPAELFVRSVAIARIKDAAAGAAPPPGKDRAKDDPKPVIEVRGEGREGAMGLEQMFSTFAQQLATDPLLPHAPQTSTRPAGAKNPFEWTLVLDFAAASPAEDEGSAAPEDG